MVSYSSSDPLKSAPLTIIRKSPLKREKKRPSTSGSGGSSESSPSNPKLDDVLLKTMNASTSDPKSAAPTPVTAAQLNQMPNVENPGNKVDNSNAPNRRSLGDLPEETVAVDQTDRPASAPPVGAAQLHIPSQGTSHKFLEQQRIRKAVKHEDDFNVNAKASRTLSFKSRKKTSSERHKLLRRNKSLDGIHAGKGARPKVAENTVNDWIKVDVKRDRPSLQKASSLNQGKSGKSFWRLVGKIFIYSRTRLTMNATNIMVCSALCKESQSRIAVENCRNKLQVAKLTNLKTDRLTVLCSLHHIHSTSLHSGA